jgi:hypothetical protein
MSKRSIHKLYVLLLVVFLLQVSTPLFAQQLNYTLNRDFLTGYDGYFNDTSNNQQTFIKPYTYSVLKKDADSSFMVYSAKDSSANKINVQVLPLVTAVGGHQQSPYSVTTSDFALGAKVNTSFGEKLSLSLTALGGRGVYNNATDSMIRHFGVVPGMAYAYRDNKDSLNGGYSYQYYTGYVSYAPHKIFNIQLGRDKHFWGDGYRSLFLSDVTAPYPYMKITTNVWKFNYVNLFTMMKDVTNPSGLKKDWLNKYSTFHYLGINITKRVHIGLFESITWQGSDSVRNRGYDINYLNPIIFYRPVEYSLGSSDNVIIGASAKIKVFKKQQVYGQFLLDEFVLKELVRFTGWWANKFGLQAGFKSFDLFTIKGLYFQSEANYVRPYTYTHGSVQQNYGHMNQPLAHPLGANFLESATILSYHYKRLFIETKFTSAVYGIDTSASTNGKNIFISYTKRQKDYDNRVAQGIKTNMINFSFKTSWLLYVPMNLRVELGMNYRLEQNSIGTSEMPYIFAGIKTDLGNFYNDY